jgi:S-DNA-T family DNA segregation ATPase FtsK/SpoIIIE
MDVADNAARILTLNQVFHTLRIKAECKGFKQVRNISNYDVLLSDGGRLKDVERNALDIGLKLRAKAPPIVRPLMSEGLVRIQIVSDMPGKIDLHENLQSYAPPSGVVPFYLGETVDDKALWLDFHTNPHLLIAGASGSGKSTLLHTIIGNALRHPNLNLFLFDTKNVEFAPYEKLNRDIRIETTYADTVKQLQWIQDEWMPYVYKTMAENELPGDYFAKPECELPYTLLVIDEFADLIMQDQDHVLYELVCRIAQKGRAAGIHFVVATQRPSVEIISGTIKANFPARISCRVSSRTDSQVILDSPDANSLLGMGDALMKSANHDLLRFQVAFSSAETNLRNHP